jgi:hypothetical protein
MIEREYYTTKEVAISTKQTTRNIRYKLDKLDVPPTMLYKDANGTYQIHHLLLQYLAPKNTGTTKQYAMTFDILDNSTDLEIIKKIDFITRMLPNINMQYGIQLKASGMKHVHAIVEGASKTKFRSLIRQYFHDYTRVYVVGVYDKQGWVKYIGRDNTEIITINNTK